MKQASANREFLKKLEEIVLENLQKEDFGVASLAEESGMSRSQLHRKIKSATGKSVTEFVREIRLKIALERLQNSEDTASEVAYQVGFNSPTYFNSCFKSYYGFTPGEAKHHTPETDMEVKGKPFASGRQKYMWMALLALTLLSVMVGSLMLGDDKQPVGNAELTKPEHKSIAILPFENLSPDSEYDYFIRGLQEELSVYLSGMQGVLVKAPVAIPGSLSSEKSLTSIAEELNVTHLLSGSFQYHNEEIRVIIKLIDPSNNDQLWNMTYDRRLEDIFEVQSDISREVASALNSRFTDSLPVTLKGRRTNNPEAYKAYLRGRDLWYDRVEEDMRKSIIQFEEAIRLDPEYAVAYAGLADTYAMMAWWDFIPEEEGYEKALELAKKSIAIEPETPEPHATLGTVYTYYLRDWEKAFEEFETALRLNPNYDIGLAWYSELLQIFNRSEEALEKLNKAIEVNPVNIIWEGLSLGILYDSGKYAEVLEKIRKREKIVDVGWHEHMRFKCLANMEEVDSLEKILEARNIDFGAGNKDLEKPHSIENMVRAYANWLEGEGKEQDWQPSSWDMVTVYAIIQDTTKVLDYLEKFFYEGHDNIYYIRSADYMEFLKNEPRYRAILDSINLNDNVYLRFSN